MTSRSCVLSPAASICPRESVTHSTFTATPGIRTNESVELVDALVSIESESSMAVFSRYWHTAVANDSSKFNYYDWNRERKTATKLTGKDNRFQPHPQEPIEMEPHLRIVCQPGGLIVFSAHSFMQQSPIPRVAHGSVSTFERCTSGTWRRGAQRTMSTPTPGTSLRDFMRGTEPGSSPLHGRGPL